MIRSEDERYLNDHGYKFTVARDGANVILIIEDFAAPPGFTPERTRLLLQLPSGFNDAGPDMFWCSPPLLLPGGGQSPGSEGRWDYAGAQWQRWSRHIGADWRPGIDSIATYLAYVRRCLIEAGSVAA